uniref:Dual serine/threonine and tyrosine protein kinase n=1 Tax=Tetranychus urticae TaxID=32264 RepID=T1JTX5_TETUR
MTRSLHCESSDLAEYKRQLKRILTNTRNNLQEIGRSGYFSKEQLTDIQLNDQIDQRISASTEINHIVEAANLLNEAHNRCLRMFILTAFDMTRDMMITPKRIAYAKQKEQQLFDSLMSIANKKQEEIKNLISLTIHSMRDELIAEAAKYRCKFNGFSEMDRVVVSSGVKSNKLSSSPLSSSSSLVSPSTSPSNSQRHFQNSVSTPQMQDQLLNSSGEEIDKYSSTGPCSHNQSLNSPYMSSQEPGDNEAVLVGSLEEISSTLILSTSSSDLNIRLSPREVQLAMVQVQDFVLSKLNAAIADNLIGSVDYLRNSYIGTLERCLESLENWPAHSSNALKQILNAAYQVEINMRTTSSLLRAFWEKMKQLVSVSLSWRNLAEINEEWKRKVAADVLDSLSESRLAKSICAQFKERLRMSHTQFATAMKQLENLHYGRLERTEEQRVRVRKYYAPRIARCALESTSLRDVILHGMPELGREIGRGQYGVVYSCDSWAGHSPVAVKSVVPPDEKHWNDLAMEFYYTRSIPEHNRIVQIRGSAIDHSYGGGSSPAVLLIMDRLSRDLYSAIKNGLDWLSRLQVAIDVVQGIRFLHSQGLVHRDIKLKNVLLDKRNRAKITDLGFCKPEAMMSGSIVGTPIHMAPELFTGKYDNSVDVYAFGILFWYICAGHVRLPYIFEQCQNKDQLWSCVRKGVRPERLPEFDSECWAIMEACWAKEPSVRPHLGDIEPKLVSILSNYKESKPPAGYTKNFMRSRQT